jgi:hypothetical protein
MTAREKLEHRRRGLVELDRQFRTVLFSDFGIVLPVGASPSSAS